MPNLFPYHLDAQGAARCRICDERCTVSYDETRHIVRRECRNAPHTGLPKEQEPPPIIATYRMGRTQAEAVALSRKQWNDQQRTMSPVKKVKVKR